MDADYPANGVPFPRLFTVIALAMQFAKADLVQQRLAFVTAALGGLLNDEHFTNLLRAEALASLPKVLDEMMRGNAP